MEIATNKPVIILPSKTPPRASGPNIIPTAIGTRIGSKDGMIISLIAAFVRRSTALSYSGFTVPSIIPGISLNCLLTSVTTELAALPTASIAIEPNINGTRPPRNKPIMTK